MRQFLAAIRPFEPVLVFLWMILIIFGCMAIHDYGGDPDGTDFWGRFANTVAAVLQMHHERPPKVILHALNISTFFYAIYFYVIRHKALGESFVALAVIVFFVLSMAVWTVGYQLTLESPFTIPQASEGLREEIYLMTEYAYTVLITIFFAIADRRKARRIADEHESALLEFSSMYLSLPAVGSLILAAILYVFYVDQGPARLIGALFPGGHLDARALTPSPELAYLTGVGAVVLFITNLILAVAAVPWYANRLEFRLRAAQG